MVKLFFLKAWHFLVITAVVGFHSHMLGNNVLNVLLGAVLPPEDYGPNHKYCGAVEPAVKIGT